MADRDFSHAGTGSSGEFLTEAAFHRRLRQEELRAQRAGVSYLLLLLESPHLTSGAGDQILPALDRVVRDTDVAGWYSQDAVAGFILTECNPERAEVLAGELRARVQSRLAALLPEGVGESLQITCRIYPEQHKSGPGQEGSGQKT